MGLADTFCTPLQLASSSVPSYCTSVQALQARDANTPATCMQTCLLRHSLLACLCCRGVTGDIGSLLQYEVTVYTSDIRGAGTDSNISIEVWGDKVRPIRTTMQMLLML
jgi:hypothetical protein